MESRFYQIPVNRRGDHYVKNGIDARRCCGAGHGSASFTKYLDRCRAPLARHLQVDRRRRNDPCRLYGQGQEDLAVLSRFPARGVFSGLIILRVRYRSNSEVRQQAFQLLNFNVFRISEAVCKVLLGTS